MLNESQTLCPMSEEPTCLSCPPYNAVQLRSSISSADTFVSLPVPEIKDCLGNFPCAC